MKDFTNIMCFCIIGLLVVVLWIVLGNYLDIHNEADKSDDYLTLMDQ